MTTPRQSYRFVDNASSSQANEFGNYILKRGMGEIRKPTWNRTETVVRILPQWNFDENRWEPFRRSPAPMDFGDWVRRYDAVRGFGTLGITMLLYDPIGNPTYDIQTNPCVILYRAIQSSISNKICDADWPALLNGGVGKRAELSRHQPIYISRAGVFRIKSENKATAEHSPLGLGNNDLPYFLELPKTAGEKLVGMLEERAEDFQGDPEDYVNAFKHGDIVSLEHGAFIHIFEEGADPRENVAPTAEQAPRQLTVNSGGRGNYGSGGGKTRFQGYDMFIEKTWNGYSANLNSPDLERLIKSKQRRWEDCLQFFSNQEQAYMVQDGFPARAIMYAWRDHSDWIKPETKAKAVNRVAVAVDPNNLPQTPVVVPPTNTPRPTSGAQLSNAVGGWGNVTWDPDADRKDAVVPASLPETPPVKLAVDTDINERERKAREGLEAAKARAAKRA
jgi:hypothetical protein